MDEFTNQNPVTPMGEGSASGSDGAPQQPVTPAAPATEPAEAPTAAWYRPTAPETPAPEPVEPEPSAYDAYYTRDGAAPASYNPSYGYRSAATQTQKSSTRGKRREIRVGAVIAICLVCVILAGALGVGGAYMLLRNRLTDEDTAAVVVEEEMAVEAEPEAVVTPVPVVTMSSAADADAYTAEEIYALACRQVVGISTEISYNVFGQMTSTSVSGSGIIIAEDGYILTNYHVIEDAYEYGYEVTVLSYDGTEYTAEILGVEPDNDLAVLKIEAGGLDAAVLADSDEMAVGQIVYTVGNPLGELTYTMTCGIVSALDRSITTDENVTVNMFQIDAAVNSGNSGGPVYNAYGQVIGIITAKYASTGVEGIGFAIPSSDAWYIANELLQNGYVSGKAYMGVSVTTVSSSVAQYYGMVEGAFINSVETGSAAEASGLEVGDIITAVDGTEVRSASNLTNLVKSYKAGQSAEMSVFRDGETITLTIVFDEEVPTEETEDESTSTEPDSYNGGSGYGNGNGYGNGGYDNYDSNPFSFFFPFN